MPILGTVASIISGNLGMPLAYYSIATVTLTSASNNITFSSIPATYKHLQLRAVSINSTAGNRLIQAGNGSVDTGNNYGIQELYGNGSSIAIAGSIGTAPSAQLFYANPDASTSAASITDILDYTNTNKATSFRTLGGIDLNGSGRITFTGGYWNNTAAVDILKVLPSGGNFEAGSKFALYGIKG